MPDTTAQSSAQAFVTKQSTPWSHPQMKAWMQAALAERGITRREAVLVLHAKVVLECGNGPKEGGWCWNYNVGNMRGTSYQGLYTVLASAWEYINGAVVIPTDQRFQAFTSHEAGVAGLLDYLQRRQPEAWKVLAGNNPNPEDYATAARAGHYFTAPLYDEIDKDGKKVAGYIPGLRSLYNNFGQRWQEAMDCRINDKELQARLKALGFDPGPIDGIVGPKTRNAIRCFQRSNGLTEDGRPTDTLRATVVSRGK